MGTAEASASCASPGALSFGRIRRDLRSHASVHASRMDLEDLFEGLLRFHPARSLKPTNTGDHVACGALPAPALKTEFPGNGIGLVTVKRIAQEA